MLGLTGICCGLLVAWAAFNALRPMARRVDQVQQADPGTAAGDRLRLVSWNIGFGGLDDTVTLDIENARLWRPASPDRVRRNAASIAETLSGFEADALFIQEAAHAGFLTRGVDVLGTLRTRLAGLHWFWWPDMRLFVPLPGLSITHGMASATERPVTSVELLSLPQGNTKFLGGLMRKFYGGIIMRLPRAAGGEWVLINLHLAAFDGAAEVRQRQLQALFGIATREFAAGHFVVLGGDWNLPLAGEEGALHRALPTGWQIVIDDRIASCRDVSLEVDEPSGHQFIDGFAISPNLTCESVETRDLKFAAADHNPVAVDIVVKPQPDNRLA